MNLEESSLKRTILDRRGAAEYLGVCVMTVDRAIRDGEIDHYRIGRRVLFDRDKHLDVFLEKNERKAK